MGVRQGCAGDRVREESSRARREERGERDGKQGQHELLCDERRPERERERERDAPLTTKASA